MRKMALKEKIVRSRYNFVKNVMGLIDVAELLIVRLLLIGIFLYGVVQVICHL
jgi:hypothetical protein